MDSTTTENVEVTITEDAESTTTEDEESTITERILEVTSEEYVNHTDATAVAWRAGDRSYGFSDRQRLDAQKLAITTCSDPQNWIFLPPKPRHPDLTAMVEIFHRPEGYRSSFLLRCSKHALTSMSKRAHRRLIKAGHAVLVLGGGCSKHYRHAIEWMVKMGERKHTRELCDAGIDMSAFGFTASDRRAAYDKTPPFLDGMSVVSLLRIKDIAGPSDMNCEELVNHCAEEIKQSIKINGVDWYQLEVILFHADQHDDGWNVVVDFVVEEVMKRHIGWEDVRLLATKTEQYRFVAEVKTAVDKLRKKRSLDEVLAVKGCPSWAQQTNGRPAGD